MKYMDKDCYVYVLYSKSECVIRYIGVSIHPSKRFFYHKYESEKTHTHMKKSRWFLKHGDIDYKVIYKGSKSDCYILEEKLVRENKSKRKLTNTSPGGDRPISFYEHSVEKQNEIREKIRKKSIGRVLSEETKRKMSESQKKLDKSYLKKYTKGKNNGRAFSVYQYSLSGEFLRKWDYAQEAVRHFGLNRASITHCITGRQKSAGGYLWSKIKSKTVYEPN